MRGRNPPFFMPEFSFKKRERLSGKKIISSLFQSGRYISSYPIRIIFKKSDVGHYPARVVISVPKRLFKNAVDRNLLKRRIREAYRLNKPEFYARLLKTKGGVTLVIQYRHDKIVDYHTIENGLKMALEQVVRILERSI